MDEALWSLEGATLSGGSVPRLDGVTLRIRPGITAVMGCSGAGKTSLLNLLVGFERPDGGAIRRRPPLNGYPLPVYWVPQDGGLWPHLTVREHVEAVAAPQTTAGDVTDLLASLDIAERAAAYPDELSAGERSRVAVARALAARPAIVVADEPLAHVDEARSGRYWRVIRDRVAESRTSLVFATHSARLVIGEAERVVCLKEGRLLYEGTVEALYRHPATQAQAECLGEVNWLEPDEAALWIEGAEPGRRCYRPEHLAVEPAHDGALVVRSSHFKGAVAETELHREQAGRARTFHHRPWPGGLRKGMRVMLRALAVLLVVWLAGCGGQAEPELDVRETHYWHMPPDGARIPAPRAAAVGPGDELFVVDTANRVVVFGPDGKPGRFWHLPESEAGASEGICLLRDGRIAVTDTHYSRVLIFTAAGELVGRFGAQGTGPGQFIYPVAVAQDDEGYLYVAEYGGNDRVQKFTVDGEPVLSFGSFGTEPEQFQRPSGLVWHEGKLYVADAINNRIQVFSDAGEHLGTLGAEGGAASLHFPYDVALGPDGALYVAEYGAGRLSKVSLEGRLLGRYGSPGRGKAQFYTPWGLAVGAGPRAFIADTGNRRIVELQL